LAHEVLGRTLDELPAQTRKLLTQIKAMVGNDCEKLSVEQKDYRFYRLE
jgi:DNA primase